MSKQKSLKVPADFPVHLFKPLQRLKWDASGKLKNEREVIEEAEKRMNSLGEHFKCPTGDQFYDQLCQAILVAILMPNQPRGPGRPLKGEKGRKERERLLKLVEGVKVEKKIDTDWGACKSLRDEKGGEFTDQKIETLRTWLRRARDERWKRNRLLANALLYPRKTGSDTTLLSLGRQSMKVSP